MDAPYGPLRWYADAGARRPFAGFYEADPSENPTVRPAPAATPQPELVRVEGEEHLVIIARRRHPRAG